MKKLAILFVLVLGFSCAAMAQDTLTRSAAIPSPDGVVQSGEYQFTKSVSGMKVSATLGTDGNLYLAIEAPTSGWVALGIGGLAMDGSRLFLSVDSGGSPSFSEQVGSGHHHDAATASIVKKWAVHAANGSTTLELVLPADSAIVDGKLDIIAAYSTSASLMARHAAHASFELVIGS